MRDKIQIRKELLALRNGLSGERITAASGVIAQRVKELDKFRNASTLMVYLSFGSEVKTDGIIRWAWENGKRIVVPLCRPASRELTPCRIDGFDELETGHYGIRAPKTELVRPVSGGEIDAILVPAVAFDRRGYRIGYGGGYYDRFLSQVPRAARIGVVFCCQIAAEVPADPHDMPAGWIVTEEETIVP